MSVLRPLPPVQISIVEDHGSRISNFESPMIYLLIIDHCSLIFERSADAYGNTLIFTGPGPDGLWFTDDDVQSDYGANEIIFCGYRFDPETQNYVSV